LLPFFYSCHEKLKNMDKEEEGRELVENWATSPPQHTTAAKQRQSTSIIIFGAGIVVGPSAGGFLDQQAGQQLTASQQPAKI
jgi:hypothetical protein